MTPDDFQTAQKSHVKRKKSSSATKSENTKKDTIRIEHLNYKASLFLFLLLSSCDLTNL